MGKFRFGCLIPWSKIYFEKLTCNISSHPLPIIWSPTTFSSGPAQTSFIFVNCFLCVMAWYMGVKDDWYIFILSSPYFSLASCSVKRFFHEFEKEKVHDFAAKAFFTRQVAMTYYPLLIKECLKQPLNYLF